MQRLAKWLGWLMSVFMLTSVATVASQVGGIAFAWSRGALTPGKIVSYAGIIYGLDPLDLAPPSPKNAHEADPETREEILAERVKNTPHLSERAATIAQVGDDIRAITYTLKRNRERYVLLRDQFESLLDQLEKDTTTNALRELQITMEVVAPKHGKEILRSMLTTPPVDPNDNAMRDVVGIIKALPDNKLKKILAEFKTDEERKLLHRILVEIGELDERATKLSRAPP